MSLRFGSKTVIKMTLALTVTGVFCLSCLQQSQRSNVPITSAETPAPVPQRASTKTFGNFSHDIAEHKQFDCTSCHKREGSSLKMEFAGHESCIGCHLNQFTDKEPAMCAICHQDTKSTDPPMNVFPAKFVEGFNMKFDHAAHDRGEARPAAGCAACHNRSGPGMTIPVGFQAHADCYSCHTAESKIGSCNVCHQLASYSRTTASQYSFKAIFTHGDHRGVSCDNCHSVVNGAAQSRQVTNISIGEHHGGTNNCASCHNGKRAFTGNNPLDVESCTRCHKGSGPSRIATPKLPDDAAPEAPAAP